MDIPLGLLSIAGVLEECNHDVKIYDGRVEGKDLSTPKPFSDGYTFGASWEEIERYVVSADPHIVGICCQFTTQFETTMKTAEVVKSANPEIVTVVGGAHASVMPESFFKSGKVFDFAVVGEGEYIMADIADWFLGKIPLGRLECVAYPKDGKIIRSAYRQTLQDLDALPFPAYHLVDLEKYFKLKADSLKQDISRPRYKYPGSERSISFITSRGCPFNCIFCSVHLHMGKKWRPHSPDYVLKHLKHLQEQYHVNHFHFEDDNLTLHKTRFEKILDGIKAKDLNFTWDTPNGVRADTLDRDLLEKSKQTGCSYLILGIESGDPYVLKNIINKKLSLKQVLKVCEMAKQVGIDLRAFYVIGFPGETRLSMKKTIDFALGLQRNFKVWPNLMIATPLIGTPLYKQCMDNGYLTEAVDPHNLSTATSSKGIIKTNEFAPPDIEKLIRYFNHHSRRIHYGNFLKGLFRHPVYFAYILINSIKDYRRVKEYCADIVLFSNSVRRHFLHLNAG